MRVVVVKCEEGGGWALVPKGKEGELDLDEAESAAKTINLALKAFERSQDQRDRSHIPPHAQRDPNARSWHWNEHPKGKFPR